MKDIFDISEALSGVSEKKLDSKEEGILVNHLKYLVDEYSWYLKTVSAAAAKFCANHEGEDSESLEYPHGRHPWTTCL